MPPKRGPPQIKSKPKPSKRRRREKKPLKLDRSLSKASAEVQSIMAAAINTNYDNSTGLQVEYGDNETLFRPIPKSLSQPLSPLESVTFGGRRKRKTRKKRGGGLSWGDAKKLNGKHIQVKFSKAFAEEIESSEKNCDVKLIVEKHGNGDTAEEVIKIIFTHNDGEDETHIFPENEYGETNKIVVLGTSDGNCRKSAEAGGARIKRGGKKKTRKKRKRKTKKKRKSRKRKKTKKRRKRRK